MAPYPQSGVDRDTTDAPVTESAKTPVDTPPRRRTRKAAPRKTQLDDGLRGHKRMAARFAAGFKGKFMWTPGRGWLEFNGSYWEECGERRPWQGVHRVCLDGFQEIASDEIRDTAERDALIEDMRRCDSADGTAGVLKHAKHWPGIGRDDQELDAQPDLFVVRNGTIDLRTGVFRASDPADLMTLAAGVDYDPAAECPLYDALMVQYQPDPEVRAYLHRLGGAGMEGRQNLQQLIVNYGSTGGNGKGTTQRAWTNVFGSYAHTLDVGALLARKGYDQYRDDKALLKGKRLVYLTEPSEGQKFDTGTVKSITGGENVTGSQKYRSAVTFPPTWLLMMSTNNRVRTPADGGMARRLKEIGWTFKIPAGTEDARLDERLHAEGSGILNRLLAGWIDFRDNGIQEPESVKAATADYLASVDPIAMFVDDVVTLKVEGHNTPSASLYKAYTDWCADNGEHAVSTRIFSPEMEKRGYVKARRGGGMVWQGIALLGSDKGW